jgi:hypothetical protein
VLRGGKNMTHFYIAGAWGKISHSLREPATKAKFNLFANIAIGETVSHLNIIMVRYEPQNNKRTRSLSSDKSPRIERDAASFVGNAQIKRA